MDTKTSKLDDKKARYASSQPQPARLDKYTILELARIPSVARVVVVENWLERVYNKAAAPAKARCEGYARMQELNGSDKAQEKSSIRGCSPSEGQVLASRTPTTTEHSARCEVDSGMGGMPNVQMAQMGNRMGKI